MSTVMAARPSIGGALCSMPQSLADAHYYIQCCAVTLAKMRNPLKFAGVPQTPELISAVSGPKFTILWGHAGEVLLFNKYFTIVDTCLSCKDIAWQICAMVRRWRFFCPVFPASCVQHISYMHTEFALRPHHVSKYGRHPICDRWD